MRQEADVNTTICENSTALIAAAGNGNATCVDLLVRAGADVNAEGREGDTALHEAAKAAKSKCLETLIHGGADVNQINEEGRTALMFAVSYILECNTGMNDDERVEMVQPVFRSSRSSHKSRSRFECKYIWLRFSTDASCRGSQY